MFSAFKKYFQKNYHRIKTGRNDSYLLEFKKYWKIQAAGGEGKNPEKFRKAPTVIMNKKITGIIGEHKSFDLVDLARPFSYV